MKPQGGLPLAVGGERAEFTARLVLEFRKALDRMLYRALSSLEGNEGAFIGDDPVCEQFVNRLVQLLATSSDASS